MRKRFQADLEDRLAIAKKKPFFWHRYYQFRDKIFAEVDNCYSLTVHNSQGSTFEQGVIEEAYPKIPTILYSTMYP